MARKKKKTGRRSGKKSFRMRIARLVTLVFFVFIVPLAVGLAAGGFLAFVRTVPSVEEMKQERVPMGTKVYADDDTLVGEIKLKKGIYFRLDRMPQHLIDAVIAVEDANFWEHKGLDYLAIVRAALKDIMKRHLKEGGSTITQQLAKITFLTPEKTIRRKLKEAVLATRIERSLSKDEILEIYLNRVYFGHGAYGVEKASQVYFAKSVTDITLPEAAILAGLLKAPNAYSPFRNFERAKGRQRIVLGRMEDEGFINRRQKAEAADAPVYLWRGSSGQETNNYFIEYVRRYLEDKYGADVMYKGGMKVYTTLDRRAQDTAQAALQRGLRDYDKRRGFRGPVEHREIDPNEEMEVSEIFVSIPPEKGAIMRGLVLKVTKDEALVKVPGATGTLKLKDAEWARFVFDEVEQEPKEIEKFDLSKILVTGDVIAVKVKSVKEGKATFALEQEPEVQGAVVAIEPGTGFIRAIVGGFDYKLSEFNRALRAKRQPGSAFKPFVFALALNHGFTPASIVVDERTEFQKTLDGPKPNRDPDYNRDEDPDYDPEEFWIPENYTEEFRGPTRLRDALAYSVNIVSVKLVEILTVRKVASFADKMGIKEDVPRDLTLGLGSLTVTPIQLTAVYGVFANEGKLMKPIGIKYVIDRRGRLVETNKPEGRQVLDRQTSYLMTTMLKDVVRYGTGWRAKALRRPVAGKTGTTNEYRDAWFLGYTYDMMAGVWVGYDDMRPLGEKETGSRAAAPIWVDFMKTISARYEPRDFPMPDGITTRLIDPETGLLANNWVAKPLQEYFKEGTEPIEFAPSIWQTRDPDNLIISPGL